MNLKNMGDREFIEEIAKRLLRIKAISPESGGMGEEEKGKEIVSILNELGFDNYINYDVKDNHNIIRPNIILKLGNCDRTFWIISHMDTVPEGDASLWKYDPFNATIVDGKIYGRGSVDNGQSIFTIMLILKHIDITKLKINAGFAFVSDEETGNDYGIKYLLKKNIFDKNDLILVPDAGTEDGSVIEIAEKSVLWLKFTILGKQGHASMPENSVNAFRESSIFMNLLDKQLKSSFDLKDSIFEPPYSTFEPTKHEKNIDNVNTIPGKDVFYYDCRILPEYSIEEILHTVDEIINRYSKDGNAKISYEVIQKEESSDPTPSNSEIITLLKRSIRERRGIDAISVGIGGSTFAAFFRKRGIHAAVWSTTVIKMAHMPDEYCKIQDIVDDVDVLKNILYS